MLRHHTSQPTAPPLSLSHHTQCNGMAALLNLILAKSLERGHQAIPSRTPALCLLALCIRCRSAKLGNCPVSRFKIFALCQACRCFAAVARGGVPWLVWGSCRGTCGAAAAAASCLRHAPSFLSHNHHHKLHQSHISVLLGFYFLWLLGDHSSRLLMET